MNINKSIKLPYESVKFNVGANFYNILNHPNFGNPASDIGLGNFRHNHEHGQRPDQHLWFGSWW